MNWKEDFGLHINMCDQNCVQNEHTHIKKPKAEQAAKLLTASSSLTTLKGGLYFKSTTCSQSIGIDPRT